MRYEHIELDLGTATCAAILCALEEWHPDNGLSEVTRNEYHNFQSNLRARLQRRDVDPHCPKNFQTEEDWLTC